MLILDVASWLALAVSLIFLVLSVRRYSEARRWARASLEKVHEAQMRFYWSMGARGVPLSVVRQADDLLAADKVDEAHQLLLEHIAD